MKIEAAIVRSPKAPFTIETVELESPRDTEVLIKVVATGLCHTDVLIKDGGIPVPENPCILGHEGAGVVESVGAAVTTLKPGDHVLMSFASCGQCDSCENNEPAYCSSFVQLNIFGRRLDGSTTHHQEGEEVNACFFGQSSFATHALVDQNNLIIAPKDLPLELLGPLGCGLQTGAGAVLNFLKPKANNSIAIFGVGAVGLAAIMAAKIAGCETIIALDIHDSRLELAKELGATHSINSGNVNAIEAIQEVCPLGINCSVEATGIPAVMATAVEALAKPGKAALLGAPPLGARMDIDALAISGGNIVKGLTEGDSEPRTFIPQLIEFYRQGKFPFDKFIKFYDFHDINKAVDDSHSGATIKPIIKIAK